MTKAEADKMFMDNLPLAEKIASHWIKTIGIKHAEDIRSSSYHGLCLAIKYYDKKRGYAFSTYAWWTILSKVREQARFLTNIKKVQINKTKQFVKVKVDGADIPSVKKHFVKPDTDQIDNADAVDFFLRKIKSDRNRDIFCRRFGDEMKLSEIGEIHGLTRQRVEQIAKQVYNSFRCSPTTEEELI